MCIHFVMRTNTAWQPTDFSERKLNIQLFFNISYATVLLAKIKKICLTRSLVWWIDWITEKNISMNIGISQFMALTSLLQITRLYLITIADQPAWVYEKPQLACRSQIILTEAEESTLGVLEVITKGRNEIKTTTTTKLWCCSAPRPNISSSTKQRARDKRLMGDLQMLILSGSHSVIPFFFFFP